VKDSDSIDKLIKRIANDDPAAFELLFLQYHKRVYSFAISLVPSHQDAEEIVQNVFIAIWDQRKRLSISASFISYLFGIARHMAYEFIKKKIQHEAFVEYFLEHNQEYAFITEEEVLFRELEELLQRLIQDLPERRREIFVLSKFDGLSYKEISVKLGISENTVDTQIRHALAFLRNKIV
jgi:RNA polymerase sigma-70 factor (ECF subfamily)